MTIELSVRESAKYIADNADEVRVDERGCAKAATAIFKAMLKKQYTASTWTSHKLNPNTKDFGAVKTIDWIFTVDLLNFSFWSEMDHEDTGLAESQRYAVEYKGEFYTGYWSLCAAINKALDNDIPITTPSAWTDGSIDFKQVFKSATKEEIPLLDERISVLREAGEVLERLGAAHFSEIVLRADKSALKLLQTITSEFQSFNDQCHYQGRPVALFKRAQILISDIWASFEGKDEGEFDDIDQITMFADYRVPQILHSLGCIKYSDSLNHHLLQLLPFEYGDRREVELRGCSIWAVELITQEILKHNPTAKINAILIDFYLWDTAKELQKTHGGNFDVPCHRTRCIYY